MGIAKHNGITRTSAESLSVKNKNADIDKSIVQVSNSEYSGLPDLSESSSSYKSVNIQLRRFHKLLQQEIHEKSQLNAGREIISTVKDLEL